MKIDEKFRTCTIFYDLSTGTHEISDANTLLPDREAAAIYVQLSDVRREIESKFRYHDDDDDE